MTELSKPRQIANLAKEIVSVTDFGAVGDGVTDDTAALESAFSSLTEGTKLYIPTGNYILNSNSMTGSFLTIPNDKISIIGDGANSTKITLTGTAEKGIFYASNKSNIFISGIEFVGNNISTAFAAVGSAIWINYTDAGATDGQGSVTVENCRFSEFRSAYWCAIHNDRTSDTFIASDFRFSNLYFSGGSDRNPASLSVAARQVGVHSVDGGVTENIIFENIYCEASNVKQGIACQASGSFETIKHVKATNCTVINAGANNPNDDVGRYGIMFYFNIADIVVDSCTIENGADCGIYCVNGESIQVTGCTFKNCLGTADSTLLKGALALSTITAAVVSGNTFIDNNYHIQTSPPSNGKQTTTISGNSFVVNNGTSTGQVKVRNGTSGSTQDSAGILISSNIFGNSNIRFFDGSADAKSTYGLSIISNQFYASAAVTFFIRASSNQKINYLKISNNQFTKIGSGSVGDGISGRGGPEFGDNLIISDNEFQGNPTGSWVDLQGVTKLTVNNNKFEYVSTGYCFTLYLCQGDVYENSFKNVTLTQIIESVAATAGDDLGREYPTWTGEFNNRVQCLNSFKTTSYAEYVWDTATTSWHLMSKSQSTQSNGATGGTGSAGAGNQYVQLTIGGTTYKVLHDGTV